MEIRSLCISPKHISNKLTEVVKKTKDKMKKKPLLLLTKKKVMISCAVLLICASVFLNYIFFISDAKEEVPMANNGNSLSVSANENNDDGYFAQAVIERQKARDDALAVLQIVVENEDALAESKDQALRQMSMIADDIQKESNIESLIVSKGFDECVAVINEGKCNVIVKCDELLPNQISQIKEIIYEQASINPIDVKIIEKK